MWSNSPRVLEPAFVPTFSPDGREIAYHAFKDGTRQIFVMPAEGGSPTQITPGGEHYWAPRWSPDGRTLSFAKAPLTPAQELHLSTRDGRGRWSAPRMLVKGGGGPAQWAPDGQAHFDRDRWLWNAVVTRSRPARRWRAAASWLWFVTRPRMWHRSAPTCPSGQPMGERSTSSACDPKDPTIGIWRVPAAGGPARLAVRFDDPARPWHQNGFRIHDGKFYFTLGALQSDVWMTELTASR